MTRITDPDALFCYGTLCFAAIIRAVIGRVPQSIEATLPGFVCYQLHGASYPAIIPMPGDTAAGVLYKGISDKELRSLDKYEGREYLRKQIEVCDASGQLHNAWGYVLAPGYYHRLKKQPWSRQAFAKHEMAQYITRHGWRTRGQ